MRRDASPRETGPAQRPRVGRRRGCRTREQVALHQIDAEVAYALELVELLDPLGDHARAQLLAQAHHVPGHDLPAPMLVDVVDQRDVQLDHGRFEPGESFEVRVASAKVVHDEQGARPAAQLGEHVPAEIVMRERRRLE